MYELNNTKIWTDPAKVEQSALDQIRETEKHPKLFKHVAIMPDVHTGYGCTIGSVVALKDAVMPAAVGYDIGCGMVASCARLHIDKLSPHFEELHKAITKYIPTGFASRSKVQMKDVGLVFGGGHDIYPLTEFLQARHPDKDVLSQLGTLGGGNHFMELQVDDRGYVWIMLHSGSRNIGHTVASHHMKIAKEVCKDAPMGMEYFEVDTPQSRDYIFDMGEALDFAYWNRYMMMKIIQREIEKLVGKVDHFGYMINIHHNYVALENHFGEDVWIHRKGATKAVASQLGIIPGSMGTASYIVRGKDNPDSYTSCSHGAGRVMSRSVAKGKMNRKTKEYKTEGRLSVDDFSQDMEGIYTTNIDRNHLDEAPRAYKDIDQVMENQKDLVDIKFKLRPIFNIKG